MLFGNFWTIKQFQCWFEKFSVVTYKNLHYGNTSAKQCCDIKLVVLRFLKVLRIYSLHVKQTEQWQRAFSRFDQRPRSKQMNLQTSSRSLRFVGNKFGLHLIPIIDYRLFVHRHRNQDDQHCWKEKTLGFGGMILSLQQWFSVIWFELHDRNLPTGKLKTTYAECSWFVFLRQLVETRSCDVRKSNVL